MICNADEARCRNINVRLVVDDGDRGNIWLRELRGLERQDKDITGPSTPFLVVPVS